VGGGRPLRVQVSQGVSLGTHADREDVVPVRERPHGAQVDRSGETGRDALGVGGLVDYHRLHDFRGVLIELDRTVVAGAGLLAAVQEGRDIVARKAADGDVLHASVDALAGEAGQAGEDRKSTRLNSSHGSSSYAV